MKGISISSWILAGLFGCIGLGCLALGVNEYLQEEAWFAKAVRGEGTVTGYDLHVRSDGKSEFCPRIEFTTQAGEPATTYGDICPSQPDKSQIGTHATFYYAPNDPSDTRTKGWFGNEGSWLIVGLIGFVFFPVIGSIGLVVEFFRSRRRTAAARTTWQPGTGGLNSTMLGDAERYRANQRAAAHGGKKAEEGSSPDAEEQLAQLQRQEEELKRKIEEQRRKGGG